MMNGSWRTCNRVHTDPSDGRMALAQMDWLLRSLGSFHPLGSTYMSLAILVHLS